MEHEFAARGGIMRGGLSPNVTTPIARREQMPVNHVNRMHARPSQTAAVKRGGYCGSDCKKFLTALSLRKGELLSFFP
jgi:hypothetical protein